MHAVTKRRASSSSLSSEVSVSKLPDLFPNLGRNVANRGCFSFTQACQDRDAIFCIALVGIGLVCAGVALCVLGITYIGGGILIALGTSFLLTILCGAILSCKDYCETMRIKALEAEMQTARAAFDAAEKDLTTGRLLDTYRHLQKLSQKREDIHRRQMEKKWGPCFWQSE